MSGAGPAPAPFDVSGVVWARATLPLDLPGVIGSATEIHSGGMRSVLAGRITVTARGISAAVDAISTRATLTGSVGDPPMK